MLLLILSLPLFPRPGRAGQRGEPEATRDTFVTWRKDKGNRNVGTVHFKGVIVYSNGNINEYFLPEEMKRQYIIFFLKK